MSRIRRRRSTFLAVSALMALVSSACDDPLSPVPMAAVDETTVSSELQVRYHDDAARMALDLVGRRGSLADAPIEIPDDLRSDLYRALIHVHNADHLAARDTVVDQFSIHTTLRPVTREIEVRPNPNTEWSLRWNQGDRFTGEPSVDDLLDRYALHPVGSTSGLHGPPVVTLRSERHLNAAALAAHFDRLDDIDWAREGSVRTDGLNIRARRAARAWILDYTVFWSGTIHFGRRCTDLCSTSRTWSFHVQPDGTVTFAGVSGSEFPRR